MISRKYTIGKGFAWLWNHTWREVRTRLIFRKCTRIGNNICCEEGKPRIMNHGEIYIGDRFCLRSKIVPTEFLVYPGARIEIGNDVFMNYGVSLAAHQLIKIGDGCQIGHYAMLMDNDYHQVGDLRSKGDTIPVILEDNVWLAAHVIVLKGVRIGNNSVVAAGSVVTRDVPPYSVVAGIPAKVIRQTDREKLN